MQLKALTSLVALPAILVSGVPWAAPPTAKPSDQVNTAPYGGPDTFFKGYVEAHAGKNVTHGPPGHVNHAPYGGPNTFFEGLEEAQRLNPTKSPHARGATAGVYICDDDQWAGHCFYEITSGGQCHPYPLTYFGSFGPDHGIVCTLYQSATCSGQYLPPVMYPGFDRNDDWPADNEYGPQYMPKSFRCRWLS